MAFVERGHLGGYIAGGDEATYYPELWGWLAQVWGVRSVIDVGCGDGHALDYFHSKLGCAVLGVEGVPQDSEDIVTHDYTDGPFVPPGHYDLVWCCEFVEHVEERFVPNFLATFRSGTMIAMTHAEPGQAGYHHVNCRPKDYWLGALAAIGYSLNAELTSLTRMIAGANPSPWNHYARSGLVFLPSGGAEKMGAA